MATDALLLTLFARPLGISVRTLAPIALFAVAVLAAGCFWVEVHNALAALQ